MQDEFEEEQMAVRSSEWREGPEGTCRTFEFGSTKLELHQWNWKNDSP